MNLSKIINPYSLFAISLSLCLYSYSLSWSGVFPKLTTQLLVFLLIVIVLFVGMSYLYNRISITSNETKKSYLIINNRNLIIINTILWLLNFAYSGIPIISGMRSTDFGIPTIIVLASSLNSFTCIYFFYLFLSTNKKRYLLYSTYCIMIFVAVISRGAIVMSLCSMFFLWVIYKAPLITFKSFSIILSSIILFLYLFGVAGNYRSIKDISSYSSSFDDTYNSDVILNIGEASESFRNSILPPEFFWTYIYITSPLSNLQYNISISDPSATPESVLAMVNNEIFFDSFSKRIDGLFNSERKEPSLIVEQLTVCTTLTGSYIYAGWSGMAIFIIIFTCIPLLYFLWVKKNPLGVIGIATLCTMYLLSVFDNMLTLTGLSFQLLYPALLFFLSKVEIKKNPRLDFSV